MNSSVKCETPLFMLHAISPDGLCSEYIALTSFQFNVIEESELVLNMFEAFGSPSNQELYIRFQKEWYGRWENWSIARPLCASADLGLDVTAIMLSYLLSAAHGSPTMFVWKMLVSEYADLTLDDRRELIQNTYRRAEDIVHGADQLML